MCKKLLIAKNGLKIEVDLDSAYFVMGERISSECGLKYANISVAEETKAHRTMSYTTDIDTLELIFQNLTLRGSSLSSADLNDPMEKERIGVSRFANGRFIVCFSHIDHESVPFWMYYGKKVREQKVLLQFRNFAEHILDCIYTDYALVLDGKKALFSSGDCGGAYLERIKNSGCSAEYDLRSFIDNFQMIDIDYVSLDSGVFSENYAGIVSVNFGKNASENTAPVSMQAYDPTILGKQKSNPWDYEKESRLLLTLMDQEFSEWKYIDLRLKPNIFEGMRIILSPWDDGTLRDKVKRVVECSSLPENIKGSIEISDSGLKEKLNFPE